MSSMERRRSSSCLFSFFILVFLLIVPLSAAAPFDCEFAPSTPEDRRFDTTRLVVVTFNAEFLFINASNCPGSDCEWTTNTTDDHIATIGEDIKSLNADIVNLVEVQDCIVLRMLNDYIGPEYRYKPYLKRGTDTGAKQNVALLTRIDPIVNLQRHQIGGVDVRAEYPLPESTCRSRLAPQNTSVSKHYWTKIVVNDIDITLVGLLPDRCAQREGQAKIIADFIQHHIIDANTEGIVMGDLNDFDEDVLDVKNSTPASKVLRMLKAPGLLPASSLVTNVSTRYSAWYDQLGRCQLRIPKDVSTIDHMLLTPGLHNRLISVEYVHNYIKTCGNASNFQTDHWPLKAVFDMTVAPITTTPIITTSIPPVDSTTVPLDSTSASPETENPTTTTPPETTTPLDNTTSADSSLPPTEIPTSSSPPETTASVPVDSTAVETPSTGPTSHASITTPTHPNDSVQSPASQKKNGNSARTWIIIAIVLGVLVILAAVVIVTLSVHLYRKSQQSAIARYEVML